MKCMSCGNEMKTARENFRYDGCGLPAITLISVEVSRCPQCGEYEVVIPAIEDLHRAIAGAIVAKRTRLTPAEVRFLRKLLGWSGADFAERMGVTGETVSRWETGAATIGPTADRLLRLMVAFQRPAEEYSLNILREVAQGQPAPTRLGLKADKSGWHAQAA